MTAIILVCHAPLGQALHAVACHAFGRYIPDVVVADISENSSRPPLSSKSSGCRKADPTMWWYWRIYWVRHHQMQRPPGCLCIGN